MPKSISLYATILRGSAVIFSSNLLARFFGFGATLVLLTSISVYEYGIWRLLLSAVTLVGIIALPGLDPAIRADLGREAGARNTPLYKAIFWQFATLLLGVGTLAAVCLFAAAPLITMITGIDVTLFLRILSLSVITTVIARIYGFAFITHLQFSRSQGLAALNGAVYLALLVVFLTLNQSGFVGVMWAYALSSAVAVVLFFPLFLNTIAPLRSTPRDSTYSLWGMIRRHGKWGLVSNYADTAVGSIKPWILGYFVSIEAVGIFSAATTILSAISNMLPLSQVLASVLPRESQDPSKLLFLTNRSIKYSVWSYVLFSAGVLVAVPLLVPLLLPHYAPTVPILAVLLLSLIALPWSDTSNTILNVFKAQKWNFTSTTYARSFSILVVLPLGTFLLGIWGAVLDQLITAYLIAGLRTRAARRVLPGFGLPPRALLRIDEYDKETLLRVWRGLKLRPHE